MCEVLDRVEARGVEKGIKQGREEIIQELKSLGIDVEELRARKVAEISQNEALKKMTV